MTAIKIARRWVVEWPFAPSFFLLPWDLSSSMPLLCSLVPGDQWTELFQPTVSQSAESSNLLCSSSAPSTYSSLTPECAQDHSIQPGAKTSNGTCQMITSWWPSPILPSGSGCSFSAVLVLVVCAELRRRLPHENLTTFDDHNKPNSQLYLKQQSRLQAWWLWIDHNKVCEPLRPNCDSDEMRENDAR